MLSLPCGDVTTVVGVGGSSKVTTDEPCKKSKGEGSPDVDCK